MAKYKAGFDDTKNTHISLTGEVWGIFCENLGENWPRYNGTTLY